MHLWVENIFESTCSTHEAAQRGAALIISLLVTSHHHYASTCAMCVCVCAWCFEGYPSIILAGLLLKSMRARATRTLICVNERRKKDVCAHTSEQLQSYIHEYVLLLYCIEKCVYK